MDIRTFTKRLLASKPEARRPLVKELAAATRTPEQAAAVAGLLLTKGTPGRRRVFLEWLVRVRGSLPDSVLVHIRPLLADRTISATIRIAAAARLLGSTPDTVAAVRPITRALTAGLSPVRGLERLRRLQHQVERCGSLDQLIDRREQRVKLVCPRCKTRLPRMVMVRHLWYVHGLFLEDGKVRGPERIAEQLIAAHAATRDTTLLDRASLLADPGLLRAWAAATEPRADDLAPLRAAAAEHDCGLCPACLAEVPCAVAPLPPPLEASHGRLAGEGYAVEVAASGWVRTIRVTGPNGERFAVPGEMWGPSPRALASLAAVPLILVLILGAARLQGWLVALFLIASGVLYAVVRFTRPALASADDRAIDAAWTVLADTLIERDGTARFLTRLCRMSQDHGDPEARAEVLGRVIEWSAEAAGRSGEWLPLLAAARVLRALDEGGNRVTGIVALAAAGFRGERPMSYAEAVVGCCPALDTEERERLRVRLLAAAFEAGLRPRDLGELWAVAPNLRHAMTAGETHRGRQLLAVWQVWNARKGEPAAPAAGAVERVMAPFCRPCPRCVTVAAVASGQVGIASTASKQPE